jgi:glycosyltransferase involved in cell wall biosynthesis
VLNGSKYYLQLSYREGFGVAVIEAMACGCVPVVTDRGALPEVVGDAGYVIGHDEAGDLPDILRRAYDPELGERARKRVVERYDISVRTRAVLASVGRLIGK